MLFYQGKKIYFPFKLFRNQINNCAKLINLHFAFKMDHLQNNQVCQ